MIADESAEAECPPDVRKTSALPPVSNAGAYVAGMAGMTIGLVATACSLNFVGKETAAIIGCVACACAALLSQRACELRRSAQARITAADAKDAVAD